MFCAGESAEQACARQGEENFTEDEEEPERSNCVTKWGEDWEYTYFLKRLVGWLIHVIKQLSILIGYVQHWTVRCLELFNWFCIMNMYNESSGPWIWLAEQCLNSDDLVRIRTTLQKYKCVRILIYEY